MSNRSVVFEKLNALVKQVPGCRVADTVCARAHLDVPLALVVDPLEPDAVFRDGDARENYAICLQPEALGRVSARLEAPPVLGRLVVLIYQGSRRYTSRRYDIRSDGTFNVERLREVLEDNAQAARARHASNTAQFERREEQRLRRLAYARELRRVLNDPKAFASRVVRIGVVDAEDEHDPSGFYSLDTPRVSARINPEGDGVRLEATVHNPKTLARILRALRHEVPA